MKVLAVRNVREALPIGLLYLSQEGQVEDSRVGPVVVAPCPVTTVYSHSRERVLLSPVRDANPFFHLAEAFWMLAGRRDARFLDEYVQDFSSRFAEPDGVLHGAYGRRWRRSFGFDQLDAVVERLALNSHDRQAVISMWDPTVPHAGHYRERESAREEFGEGDLLNAVARDRPCNTHIYLRVRSGQTNWGKDEQGGDVYDMAPLLDITVCCRSNDMVMGAHGANVCHFSILQEYLAARIGVGVGTYYQMSNNYHAYLSDVRRMVGRVDKRVERADPRTQLEFLSRHVATPGDYGETRSLFDAPKHADEDIEMLLRALDHLHREVTADEGSDPPIQPPTRCQELGSTVFRALAAHRAYRLGLRESAIMMADGITSPDWRQACLEWIQRRRK